MKRKPIQSPGGKIDDVAWDAEAEEIIHAFVELIRREEYHPPVVVDVLRILICDYVFHSASSEEQAITAVQYVFDTGMKKAKEVARMIDWERSSTGMYWEYGRRN